MKRRSFLSGILSLFAPFRRFQKGFLGGRYEEVTGEVFYYDFSSAYPPLKGAGKGLYEEMIPSWKGSNPRINAGKGRQ